MNSARTYAINVLVTDLPRGHDDDIMKGATADMVIDAYLGQYRVEHAFRMTKSDLNMGKVYIHSPARQDAMIFLTSVTTMIHAVIDNTLSPDLDSSASEILDRIHVKGMSNNAYDVEWDVEPVEVSMGYGHRGRPRKGEVLGSIIYALGDQNNIDDIRHMCLQHKSGFRSKNPYVNRSSIQFLISCKIVKYLH